MFVASVFTVSLAANISWQAPLRERVSMVSMEVSGFAFSRSSRLSSSTWKGRCALDKMVLVVFVFGCLLFY